MRGMHPQQLVPTRLLVSLALAVPAAAGVPSPAQAVLPAPPAEAQVEDTPQLVPLGPGPQWRGSVLPAASNEVFATSEGCSMCHSPAATATAMQTATGDDASPFGLWQATMMANSFRDPYWRASMAREVAANPDAGADVEGLCIRCHAPMVHHTAHMGGTPVPRLADLVGRPFAEDGVSCTVCHKIEETGLGTEATFSGLPVIGRDRAIYGPFKDPADGPMRQHAGYEPQIGAHVRSSAMCGTCHTLTTHYAPNAPGFKEQTPYLEWRNSVFTNEGGRTEHSRSCQECHMADVGEARIARNPAGRDFLIEPRELRAHAFVGGNAFLLDMFARHREELGAPASEEQFQRAARATRAQLSEHTAEVTVSPLRLADGHLEFDVTVKNLTGHKLPTGYPSRRMWLRVQVRAGNRLLFENGRADDAGRIPGVDDVATPVPHRDLVERPEQVVVYELVAANAAGEATTLLTEMATRLKDTRLLPRGWRADGPHADATVPVSIGDDPNFADGKDRVTYRIPMPEGVEGRLRVLAYLHYQTVPPLWVAPLRAVDHDDARRFVGYYDDADKTPETLGIGQSFGD
jgi:hypothetical protein